MRSQDPILVVSNPGNRLQKLVLGVICGEHVWRIQVRQFSSESEGYVPPQGHMLCLRYIGMPLFMKRASSKVEAFDGKVPITSNARVIS